MIAQQAVGSEQLARWVMQEVGLLWSALREAESGESTEEAVVAWSRRVGRRVLELGIQARLEEVEGQAERECSCGGRQQVHSRQPRTGLTALGAVRVQRRYLRCPRCGTGRRPADGWLGWKHGFSRRVEEAVAWSAAALPYRPALEGLRRFCGIELSLSAAQEIVARCGEKRLELDPYAERVSGRLGVEIDGAMAHIDGDWHEVKLGSFFAWRAGKAETISYVADWLTSDQFRTPLWEEAVIRGAPKARKVAVLADGAAWIWETSGLLFPGATEILDWYHACEHLWEAGRVIHGEGKPETQALVQHWKGDLYQGYSEGLEQELRELAAAKRDPEETLRKTADYLNRHQARLRYPHFRQAGWPIGSGIAEGGVKHVIDLRFKRKSARWKSPGFRSVLHLRLDILNSRWEERWDSLRKAP